MSERVGPGLNEERIMGINEARSRFDVRHGPTCRVGFMLGGGFRTPCGHTARCSRRARLCGRTRRLHCGSRSRREADPRYSGRTASGCQLRCCLASPRNGWVTSTPVTRETRVVSYSYLKTGPVIGCSRPCRRLRRRAMEALHRNQRAASGGCCYSACVRRPQAPPRYRRSQPEDCEQVAQARGRPSQGSTGASA
jgi:hypothetical protein